MTTKPEDIPQDVWDCSAAVEHVYCGCAPGRSRENRTSHHDSCWQKVEAHARAILAAKAEEREACVRIVFNSYRNHTARCSRIVAAIRKRGEG